MELQFKVSPAAFMAPTFYALGRALVGDLSFSVGGTLLTSHPPACDDRIFGPYINCRVGG